ncbi:MAG: HAD-IA family hydrolase [Planctomycetaceae bacterium]
MADGSEDVAAASTGVSWVVFDVVGTLLFADPPVHMAYHRIGQKYGSSITPIAARERFGLAMRECRLHEVDTPDATPCSEHQTSEDLERSFWRRVIDRVLPDVSDRQGCFDELYDHFARPTSWQCFADVEETLEQLNLRGIRFALASNFDHRLHEICEGLPAISSISTRLIASEVGWRKPSSEFYAAMVKACGGRGENILMVGDSPDEDVAAPKRAGLRALWLDRSGKGPGDIRSLLDLIPQLD